MYGMAHIGGESLKKPHHIVTLRFSEVVKDHANYKTILIIAFEENTVVHYSFFLDLAHSAL